MDSLKDTNHSTILAWPVKGIIDVVNHSVVKDQTIQKWIDAIKIQCDRDVSQYWGATVELNYLGKRRPKAGHWMCGIFNNTDEPGVLGWHDLGPNGEPLMKIFTSEAARFHEDPCITLSHEVLESIGDTDANTTVTVTWPDTGKPRQYYLENCDAVESFHYTINGQKVSNFVTRNWFSLSPSPNIPFDFLKKCIRPFEITPGGYMEVNDGYGWHEINAMRQTDSKQIINREVGNRREYTLGRHLSENVNFNHQAGIHQRRYRRKKLRTDWIFSNFEVENA